MTTWNLQGMQKHLLICNGSTCMGAGAEEITLAIRDEIAKHKLDEQIHTSRTRCNGRCRDKCIVISYPEGNWFSVPNDNVARGIVTDSIDEEHKIYTMGQDGLQQVNGQYGKGISKSKHRQRKNGKQTEKKAVLFVGHGSRLERGNEEVREFIKRMKKLLGASILVETCFLEFASPNIEEGIEICVEKGAQEIHVIPIILLHAGHSKLHIPAEIEHAREHFPDVYFTYGQTIGIHDEIFEILKTRLMEVGIDPEARYEETAILLIARGSSDSGAKDDFYSISRLLWEKLNIQWVESAFMGVTTPTVEEGIERCINLGAKRIIMLPYFLFTGILMERMNQMREKFAELNPQVEIEIASYFGYHEKLQHILVERAEQAMNGTSTGMQDLENYRAYAKEHGPVHHHH
ncbi:sirohydrochlorin cobaltochelatase [Lysinibacillus yapensis]|uniref:Sirohydrochlorin cobaltochelatase n=1 Tax=Ureibacillus yapensis TaxID=2304605 RepID=A0A396SSM6_9BACL|nr:CbiX/SirB N-terminal domain-containing protein [Lysinibacillus yapensis]RHW39451.1 sirohydrochlorin cobaltochelatase [Lysinibacillus yapensis]